MRQGICARRVMRRGVGHPAPWYSTGVKESCTGLPLYTGRVSKEAVLPIAIKLIP